MDTTAQMIRRVAGIITGVAILIVLGGYVYVRISAPHVFATAQDIDEVRVTIALSELRGATFLDGMDSAENLYVETDGLRVYVTDLDGHVHLLDGPSREQLKIVKSMRLGQYGLGIDKGPDGFLYVGFSQFGKKGWIEKGGAVYRIDRELEGTVKVTTNYPTLNGLACDNEQHCYFASSNMDFLSPAGNVYRMQVKNDGSHSVPEIWLEDVGLANGLHYDADRNRLLLSNTMETVSSFASGDRDLAAVYRKTRYLEATDDICTDSRGTLWMSDLWHGTVKNYDPETKRLVRFDIEGIGQTSACGIRQEEEGEVLYLAEIKTRRAPLSDFYDGRGILIVPLESLTSFVAQTP